MWRSDPQRTRTKDSRPVFVASTVAAKADTAGSGAGGGWWARIGGVRRSRSGSSRRACCRERSRLFFIIDGGKVPQGMQGCFAVFTVRDFGSSEESHWVWRPEPLHPRSFPCTHDGRGSAQVYNCIDEKVRIPHLLSGRRHCRRHLLQSVARNPIHAVILDAQQTAHTAYGHTLEHRRHDGVAHLKP